MMHRKKLSALVGVGMTAGLALGAGETWFVDDDAAGGGDGTTWSTAFDTLDDALAVARAGDQVWVAQGVYSPATLIDPADMSTPSTDPLDATFYIRKSVKVYGGFAGNEATLAERAGLFDQTILTGMIVLPDGTAGNARHVVFYFSEGNGSPGRLDGFVVRDGMAGQGTGFGGGGLLAGDLDGPDDNNSVWSVRIDVANCRFEDNTSESGGGGMLINGPSILTNTVFVGNTAVGHGGGLATGIFGANTQLIGCSFIDNTAGLAGGGFSSRSGGTNTNPYILNCRFIGNAAGVRGGGFSFAPNGNNKPMRVFNTLIAQNTADIGGGVWLQGGRRLNDFATIRPSVTDFGNCTFADNTATTEGGGLFLGGDASDGLRAEGDLYTSIIWGNGAPIGPQLSDGSLAWWSSVQGGWAGGFGNLDVDPMFVNAAERDYRLKMMSPLVDSAISYFAATDEYDLDGDGNTSEFVPFDLDGNLRFYDIPFVPNTGADDPAYMDYGALETYLPSSNAKVGAGTPVFLKR